MRVYNIKFMGAPFNTAYPVRAENGVEAANLYVAAYLAGVINVSDHVNAVRLGAIDVSAVIEDTGAKGVMTYDRPEILQVALKDLPAWRDAVENGFVPGTDPRTWDNSLPTAPLHPAEAYQSEYKVYTTDYDRETHISSLFDKEFFTEEYSSPINEFLDGFAPSAEAEAVIADGPPVTILMDLSGSMRGEPIAYTAAVVREFGDRMAAIGRPFEILGHTTTAWKGGEARSRWLEDGRPRNPGRLAPILHLELKRIDEDWAETRKNMGILLQPGLLKENIDGEALEWVARRVREREMGPVIVISDGAPIDDSTLSVNPADFLTRHAQEVIDRMGDIPLHAIHLHPSNPKLVWPSQDIITPDDRGHFSSDLFLEKLCEAVRKLDPSPDVRQDADETPEP